MGASYKSARTNFAWPQTGDRAVAEKAQLRALVDQAHAALDESRRAWAHELAQVDKRARQLERDKQQVLAYASCYAMSDSTLAA